MVTNYLDKTGLGTLWGKIKALVPTKVSDLNNDSGFQTQAQVNALIAAAGADGKDGKSAYQYAVDGGYTGTEQEFAAKMAAEIPTKTSQLSNDSGYMTGLFLASYGHTSFADIKAAYLANKIVYCKTSAGTDPGLGNQLRQAFLAYIGGSDKNPTSFEFQYYRSVKSHSNSQQGDQVFIYTIDSSSTWSVTTREAYTKIVARTGINASYSNGVLTLTCSEVIPTKVSDLNNDSGFQTQAQVNALIAAAGDDDTTYAISMSGNVITLTSSDGNTSTVTLPVYTGGVV